jgi:methyl-accepting chemotaxis protein
MDGTSNGVDAARQPRRRRLSDLPVAVRIAAVAAVGVIATVTVGAVAYGAGNAARNDIGVLYSRDLVPSVAIAEIRSNFLATRLDVANFAAQPDKAARTKQIEKFAKVDSALDESIATYAGLRPERAKLNADIARLVAEYRTLRDKELVPAVQAGDLSGYQKIRAAKVVPISDAIMSSITDEVALSATEASQQRDSATAELTRANWIVIVVLLLALLLAIVVSVVTIRSITNPLKAISRAIAALKVGDLTQRSGLDSRDELGRTAADVDAALDVLTGTITAFTVASDEVRAAASSVETTAKAIVVQAESSAADAAKVAAAGVQLDENVSTLAATGVQMGATIAEVAQSASTASNTASSATEAASAASATIRRLGESSRQIAEVTELISSIASQTRLLALNATIESARAGEAGRGFAVVATEVKTLATETANASQDVQDRVAMITRDVNDAVLAIDEITRVIEEISETQSTIAAAVEEQSAVTQGSTIAVQHAADGASSISHDIAAVASGSSSTLDSGRALEDVVVALTSSSDDLSTLVSRFTLTSAA